MDKFFYCYNAMCQKVNSTSVFSFDPYFFAIKKLLLCELRRIAFYIQKLKNFNENVSSYNDKVIEFLSALIVNLDFHRDNLFEIIKDLYKNGEFLEKKYHQLCKENNEEPDTTSKSDYIPDNKNSILRALNNLEKNITEETVNLSKNRKCLYDIMLNLILNSCNALIELKRYGVDLSDEKNEVIKLLNLTNITALSDDEQIEKVKDFAKTNFKITKILADEINKKFGPVKKNSVPLSIKKGKCILISGGSFIDLEKVLELSKNKDINVYVTEDNATAFLYEKLSSYQNLTAVYNLKRNHSTEDFSQFHGPIFVSGNTVSEISAIRGQIYTDAKYPPLGIAKISDNDFNELTEYAKTSSGFKEDINSGSFEIGYCENEINNLITDIKNKFTNKEIKRVILLSHFEDNDFINSYIEELLKGINEDTYIISFSTESERKNFKHFNTINDFTLSYKIVSKLKENGFNKGISVFLFELKNSVISTIFNFLYFDIKNIFIAHCCPDTASPDLSKGLSEMFNVKEITSPEEDKKFL